MISGVTKLGPRLVGAQLVSSLLAMAASTTCRWLLLLDGDTASASVRLLCEGLALGGCVALARTAWLLRRRRFLTRTLALGSTAIDPGELSRFATEAGRATFAWLTCSLAGVLGVGLVARPSFVDTATIFGVTLFGTVVVMSSALPLYAWMRHAVMRAIENAPVEVARAIIESKSLERALGGRIRRRLVAALVTPVVFVTVGSTLVVTAHVRKADGERRDAIALAMARAAFETVPGPLPNAGIEDAELAARRFGFSAHYARQAQEYRRSRTRDGDIELIAPLDEGSVRVDMSATTFRGIGSTAWLVAAIAAVLAAAVGRRLGTILIEDVQSAIVGVRALDTKLVLQGGTSVVGPTRLRVVSALGASIEELAGRFRLFAETQERALLLRAAATRMRGQFFASVSHDLKTPLNAILGFAAVIRQTEELTLEQEESLAVIERSGRELLALIEMILDAARVEARQLRLHRDPVTVGDLMREIIEKGRYLAGDNGVEVVGDIADGIGTLEVDRIRLASALGTFLGYAGRTVPRALIRLHIAPLGRDRVGFAIEIPPGPSTSDSVRQARSSNPSLPRIPLSAGHRGLALGMNLARSVIELHGGTLTTQDRGPKGQRFVAVLPARRKPSGAQAASEAPKASSDERRTSPAQKKT